jgi:DNA-binding CsgD family transcriptional regulator
LIHTVAHVVQEFALSPGEAEVLVAAAEGRCTKEIAVDLGVIGKTVEYFWGRIYAKLRCASQIEVMALPLRRASGKGRPREMPGVGGTITRWYPMTRAMNADKGG